MSDKIVEKGIHNAAYGKQWRIAMLSTAYRLLGAEKGMSLVEVMIALLVLLFVSLALMQTALVSIESNMKNVLRDTAVSIAEERIADARGMAGKPTSYTTLVTDDTPADISKQNNMTDCPSGPGEFMTLFGANGVLYKRGLKNIGDFRFCTHREVTELGAGAEDKQVVVTVAWRWKGDSYSHVSSTILGRP